MAWATMPQYIEKRWLDKMDQAGIVSDIEKKEQQQAAPSVRMAG
jgi:hypothetical protein